MRPNWSVHWSVLWVVIYFEYRNQNKMFFELFVRGPWPKTSGVSYSGTNQTANKTIDTHEDLENFAYLHKTEPRQKMLEISPNFCRNLIFKGFSILVGTPV